MVVTEEHGTHAALFNQFLADKDIERELCDFGRKREHQEFKAQAFDKFALFFGGRKEQRIAGATQYIVRMRFKTDDGRRPAIHFGNGLKGTEKRLVSQVTSVKISHRHSTLLFYFFRHSLFHTFTQSFWRTFGPIDMNSIVHLSTRSRVTKTYPSSPK